VDAQDDDHGPTLPRARVVSVSYKYCGFQTYDSIYITYKFIDLHKIWIVLKFKLANFVDRSLTGPDTV